MTDTTTKYGFHDLVHNVTVGPLAQRGTFREQAACGAKRIKPLTAETFDLTYPQWTMSGKRETLIKANTADFAERAFNSRADHNQV